MKQCFAPDCTHVAGISGCSLHRFPKAPSRLRRWVKLVRRGDRLPNDNDRLCDCHFLKGSYSPTIFKRNPLYSHLFRSPARLRKKRLLEPDEPDLRSPPLINRTITILGGGVCSSASARRLTWEGEDDVNDPVRNETAESLTPANSTGSEMSSEDVCVIPLCTAVDAGATLDKTLPIGNVLNGNAQIPVATASFDDDRTPSVNRNIGYNLISYVESHRRTLSEGIKVVNTVKCQLKDLLKAVEVLQFEKNELLCLLHEKDASFKIVKEERDNALKQNQTFGEELCHLRDIHAKCHKIVELEENLVVKDNEIKDLSTRMCTSFRQSEELKDQLEREKSRLMIESISLLDFKITYYTGLPNAATFRWLVSLFDNYSINYYSGNVVTLSKDNQLFMTLMKLRRGFGRQELADWFHVSTQAVSNITITWCDALHTVLFQGFMGDVPSLSKNQQSLPECFNNFRNCRIVLDCTEVMMGVPRSMKMHNLVYSHYKSYTTLKGLVGVAPNGAPTFASKLYPGSTSDKAIVKSSGVLRVLKPGESVMVDKGFLISDMLPAGVQLVRPPFKTTAQFTAPQIKNSKEISQARIHVERAIRRIKLFEILRYVPRYMVPHASKVFQVCMALTALMRPLMKEVECTLRENQDSDDSEYNCND